MLIPICKTKKLAAIKLLEYSIIIIIIIISSSSSSSSSSKNL
jgi:hypothetical protein